MRPIQPRTKDWLARGSFRVCDDVHLREKFDEEIPVHHLPGTLKSSYEDDSGFLLRRYLSCAVLVQFTRLPGRRAS